MKNLFVILFAILPIVAAAQTMCVRDNSLVISLDANINPSSKGGSNDAESIWWVDFPYGRIYGEGTILSETEGLGQTTSGKYYGTGEYTNTLITAEPGLSGLDANGNERKYCWCRMTHPFLTPWVFNRDMGNSCADGGCPGICAYSSNMLIRILRELGGSWHNDL